MDNKVDCLYSSQYKRATRVTCCWGPEHNELRENINEKCSCCGWLKCDICGRCKYDKFGFDQTGKYRTESLLDESGFNYLGKDKDGYNRDGYDDYGYDREGYDVNGYDDCGYNREGYNKYDYDRHGCDKLGYDRDGFNQIGMHRNGTKYNDDGFYNERRPESYVRVEQNYYFIYWLYIVAI